MSQLVDDLKAARALIAEPEHWTRGEYARDRAGNKVPDHTDEAVRFCAIGACWRVKRVSSDEMASASTVTPLSEALTHVLRSRGSAQFVSEYNDNHSHAEVLALFDAAITAAEVEETAS